MDIYKVSSHSWKGKLEGAKDGARNKSANKSPVGHGFMEGT